MIETFLNPLGWLRAAANKHQARYPILYSFISTMYGFLPSLVPQGATNGRMKAHPPQGLLPLLHIAHTANGYAQSSIAWHASDAAVGYDEHGRARLDEAEGILGLVGPLALSSARPLAAVAENEPFDERRTACCSRAIGAGTHGNARANGR